MLFNSLQFAIFFAVVLLAYRPLPPRARRTLLLSASLFFYACWYPPYLVLLALEILVNYALLRAMVRSKRPRLFLGLSVCGTLGILAYTKYATFLVESVGPAMRAVLGVEPAAPSIELPLGISFYSFQIIALTVDVYRGHIAPVRSLSRYALFVCFFPQLIAGPILRGAQFLPQLAAGGRITPDRSRRGIWLLTCGLAKKIILADFLLAPFVDRIFAEPGVASAPFHLVAAYSFAFQIYFDFSGYTDMARGLALLLGYELPLNFTEPYLSRNPTEFWRRWHITLSEWLRDYLYIPLGGNRHGAARTDLNLMITMLLGGLWHGAAWNFVIWGGLHGLLLALHRRFRTGSVERRPPSTAGDVLRIVLFFHVVSALLIVFRAPSLGATGLFMRGLLGFGTQGGVPVLQSLVIVLCYALHVLERIARERLTSIRARLERSAWGGVFEGAAIGSTVALALALAGAGGEFIYFQF